MIQHKIRDILTNKQIHFSNNKTEDDSNWMLFNISR